uniref:Uncharacterized protein n=2 Tax=Hyaloperonospora arabidopsidis (strain Emoy2) TaxID=559515 RepID=M4BFA9_HYAAE
MMTTYGQAPELPEEHPSEIFRGLQLFSNVNIDPENPDVQQALTRLQDQLKSRLGSLEQGN